MTNLMTTLALTIFLTIGAFAFFFVAIGLKRIFGKEKQRRCACKMSKALLKDFETRAARARQAARYNSKTLDPANLPIVGQESGMQDHDVEI